MHLQIKTLHSQINLEEQFGKALEAIQKQLKNKDDLLQNYKRETKDLKSKLAKLQEQKDVDNQKNSETITKL